MSTTTLLHGGAVIDGTGSAPQLNTSVLIRDEKILAVGAEADVLVQSLQDVKKIDVAGLTVMPGLIDAHTHVTLGEPASNDELFHPLLLLPPTM
jgi:imidazolonepropionase-like amidohydrolase